MTRCKLRHLAATAALLSPSFVSAIPFDNSSSSVPATASVGLSGDYLTLSAAAAAFSALSGVNRPWVLEIQNDITEASNCYFGATFGANGSLTIRPAPSATPTVTFTNTNDPSGYDGHLVLGARNGAAIDLATTPSSTGRYIVDGCNVPGGTTRDLTIQAGTPAVSIASGSEVLLNLVGNTDLAVVRNVNLGMYDTSGFTAALALTAVRIAGTDLAPDGTTIRNCSLSAGGTAVNANGLLLTEVNGLTLATGSAIQNTLVEDCAITARQYGILMLATADATIQRNSIVVSGGTNPSPAYAGILHQDSNEIASFVMTIRRNRVGGSAPGGLTAVHLTPGPTTQGTYVLDDNIVNDFAITGLSSPTVLNCRGIVGGSGLCSYIIEHNSIRIPHNANISISGPQQVIGIGLSAPVSSPHTAQVRNNIVRVEQATFGAAALSYASHVNVTSNHNCLSSADMIGWVGGTPYLSFAAWNTGGSPPGFFGFDGGGQSVNPFTTTPAWDGDLHFASKPVAGLAVVASSGFSTDFDGDPRPFTGALPGADEPTATTGVGDWPSY